jgi:hypothetical protein
MLPLETIHVARIQSSTHASKKNEFIIGGKSLLDIGTNRWKYSSRIVMYGLLVRGLELPGMLEDILAFVLLGVLVLLFVYVLVVFILLAVVDVVLRAPYGGVDVCLLRVVVGGVGSTKGGHVGTLIK